MRYVRWGVGLAALFLSGVRASFCNTTLPVTQQYIALLFEAVHYRNAIPKIVVGVLNTCMVTLAKTALNPIGGGFIGLKHIDKISRMGSGSQDPDILSNSDNWELVWAASPFTSDGRVCRPQAFPLSGAQMVRMLFSISTAPAMRNETKLIRSLLLKRLSLQLTMHWGPIGTVMGLGIYSLVSGKKASAHGLSEPQRDLILSAGSV